MDSNSGYNLDLSLFERVVRQGGLPVNTLSEQHRMRPEISRFIRATIYPSLKASSPRPSLALVLISMPSLPASLCHCHSRHLSLPPSPARGLLQDHPKVHRYRAVKGMQRCVFWMTHTAPEGGDRDDLSSKFNAHEAQMATRLARYLVQNGYGGGE